MCSSMFGFCLIIIMSIGHSWLYYLNSDVTVDSINIFGYHMINISIADIHIASVIWNTVICVILYCCLLFNSFCDSTTIMASDSTQEVQKLKNDNRHLNEQITRLSHKLKLLQNASKKIQFLVPYDLNTLVERNMINKMPDMIYSPLKERNGMQGNQQMTYFYDSPSNVTTNTRYMQPGVNLRRPPKPWQPPRSNSILQMNNNSVTSSNNQRLLQRQGHSSEQATSINKGQQCSTPILDRSTNTSSEIFTVEKRTENSQSEG